MKDNGKKILIYTRYILPVLSHIVMIAMFFVPSYIFILDGKAGNRMSLANFISAYWEKSRDVLFGTAEHTGSDELFAKIMFVMIIAFAIFFVVSFAISIWTAIVAFRVFLSNDEDSAESGRKFFVVFVPNRIIACVFSSIGILISTIPYFITPLTSLTGATVVKMVLEFADTLTVGGILLVICLVFSVGCSYVEKYMGVDVFKKDKVDDEESDLFDDEEDEQLEDDMFDDED